MDGALPLPALLSQALVAFTIECDNEFEGRMPHCTTNHSRSQPVHEGPWLVSLVMWWNCLRFVGTDGITVTELKHIARTETNVNGMQRWGYIAVGTDGRIRITAKGRKAQAVAEPLIGLIEQRWRARFGDDAIDELRRPLTAIVARIDADLPDCLPIVHYGLFTPKPIAQQPTVRRQAAEAAELPLPALLAKVLLSFALLFERKSDVSLAIAANVLRLIDRDGVRTRDLPRLAGVSKEAIAMSLSYLVRHGYADIARETSGRGAKTVILTPHGRRARTTYQVRLSTLEQRWQQHFGAKLLGRLRFSLRRVAGQDGDAPALMA